MRAYVDFYNEFLCLGGDCIRTCCTDWSIDLDPETAAFYDSLTDEFGIKLKEKIQKNADGSSMLILNPGEYCPAFNDERLCGVYTHYGENRMCRVCTLFPRLDMLSYESTGCSYQYLEMHCEEVLNLLMKRKMPFGIALEYDDDPGEDINTHPSIYEAIQYVAWSVHVLQDNIIPIYASLPTVLGIKGELETLLDNGDYDAYDAVILGSESKINEYKAAVEMMGTDEVKNAAWNIIGNFFIEYIRVVQQTSFGNMKEPMPDNQMSFDDEDRVILFVRETYERFLKKNRNWNTYMRRFYSYLYARVALLILDKNRRKININEYVGKMVISTILPCLWEESSDRELWSRMSKLQRIIDCRQIKEGLWDKLDDNMQLDEVSYAIMMAGLWL